VILFHSSVSAPRPSSAALSGGNMKKQLGLCFFSLVIIFVTFILAPPAFAKNKAALPSIDDLLKDAGYTKKSTVQIYMASVSLENAFYHTPTYDVYYYVFLTRAQKPIIEKIRVIVYNHQDTDGINLLMFAPGLVFTKCIEMSPYPACGSIEYYPKELYAMLHGGSDRDSYKKFVILPPAISGQRMGEYLFEYNSKLTEKRSTSSMDQYLDCPFNEIFERIMKEGDDASEYASEGHAKMCVMGGDKMKSFCVENGFIKIYPSSKKR
jgi:hypothetical protein